MYTSITFALEASSSMMKLPNLCLPALFFPLPPPLHFSLQRVTCPSSFPCFPHFHSLSVEPPPAVPLLPLPPTPANQPSLPTHGSLMGRKDWEMEPSSKTNLSPRTPCYLCPRFFWAALNCWLSGTAVRLLALVRVSTMQCFSLAA